MAKKATIEDGTRKVVFPIGDDLYNEIKLTAIGEGKTVSEFVVALLQREAPALRQKLIEKLSTAQGGVPCTEAVTV